MNIKMLYGLAKFAASSEKHRYYLCSVCLDTDKDGKTIAVATDGHKLLAANMGDCGLEEGQHIIPRDFLLSLKITTRTPDDGALLINDGKVFITYEITTISAPCVDGKFPEWRRVMPKSGYEIEPAKYNPKYIMDMENFGKLVSGMSSSGLSEISPGGNNPAFVRFDANPEVIGVLMPMRANFNTTGPDWICL